MTLAHPDQVVLGLDAGTTGVKAVAFALEGSWHKVVVREYPLLHPTPDEAVQDPMAVLSACREALAECVAALGGAEVLALAVGAGMHGLVAVDEAVRPLTPLVTWADTRAREEARELRRAGLAPDLLALTGAPVHPMTPLLKLLWYARHEPGIWRAARWWVGLKELLLYWLTEDLVTELSSASGSGLLDMRGRAWSGEALQVCGVAADKLPPILPTTAVLPLAPAAADELGLPAGTPVVAGAGDGPLASLGAGALSPGVAGLSLGTSGAIRLAVDGPRVDAGRSLFCYALTDEVWVTGGAVSNGGAVLRWVARVLGEDGEPISKHREDAMIDLAAQAPPGCDGLVMVPYLLAERAPLWDPDLPGAYLGLRRAHTRAHLARAAIEGVCLQLRLVLERVDEMGEVRSLRATGGALRSPLWREVLAAALDRPLQVVAAEEGTALGAAALALVALGVDARPAAAAARLLGPEQAAPPQPPDPALVAVYRRQRALVAELIDALEPVARLFGEAPDPL